MSTEPMIFYPLNFCPKCKSTAIELYTWHNYAQNYGKMLTGFKHGEIASVLNKYAIYTMKCSKCGHKFDIHWKQGIPTPMRSSFYMDLFMSIFKENSLNGRPKISGNSYKLKLGETES